MLARRNYNTSICIREEIIVNGANTHATQVFFKMPAEATINSVVDKTCGL